MTYEALSPTTGPATLGDRTIIDAAVVKLMNCGLTIKGSRLVDHGASWKAEYKEELREFVLREPKVPCGYVQITITTPDGLVALSSAIAVESFGGEVSMSHDYTHNGTDEIVRNAVWWRDHGLGLALQGDLADSDPVRVFSLSYAMIERVMRVVTIHEKKFRRRVIGEMQEALEGACRR